MALLPGLLCAGAVLAVAHAAVLFGLSAQVQLVTIDESTGAISPVGQPLANIAQAQQLSAMDDKNAIFYLIGYNLSSSLPMLIGLDLKSGSIVRSVKVPFGESTFVGVGQQIVVDPDTSQVYVGGQQTASGDHIVGSIDPKSGAFKQIASISGQYDDVLGGDAIFDPKTRQMIIQLGVVSPPAIDLFAINVDNGTVTEIDESLGKVCTTLAYDSKSGLVWGTSLVANGTGYERSIDTLDPASKTFREVTKVPSFFVESAGISTVDEVNGLFFWIGNHVEDRGQGAYYLVGHQLKDGQIVRSPKLCDAFADCPWSVEAYNPPSQRP